MAGICFYFESYDVDVWSGHNLDAWSYAAKACGDIDKIIVINKTGTNLSNPDCGTFDFQVVSDVPVLEGSVATLTPPWECSDDATSLWDFDHKVDWYYFGPASARLNPQGQEVFLPQNGIAALHSVHIASTVLMHRYGVVSWQ